MKLLILIIIIIIYFNSIILFIYSQELKNILSLKRFLLYGTSF